MYLIDMQEASAQIDQLDDQLRETSQQLSSLRDQIDVVRGKRRQAVQEAYAAGLSWQDIGDILGISRQAAWQQFHNGTDQGARTSRART